jgi:hypothetical protein
MSRIEIRPYDGNLEALRKLAYSSWMAEYPTSTAGSWPDFYTPALARYYFDASSDPRLLVAAYLEGEIVGFLANLPREYRFRGRRYKGMISGLLAVSPELPAALGVMLSVCMQGNKEYGADFSLFTLEKDHKTLRLAKALSASRTQAARQTACLVTQRPLVHAIDFPTTQRHEALGTLATLGIKLWGAHRPILPIQSPGEVRPCRPADLPGVLVLTEQVPDQHQLVRVFDLPALERRFNSGDLSTELGGMVVYERQQQIKGFISFSTYIMVNERGSHPWAWVDLVCWEGCSMQEKHSLIAGAWALCKARGCIGMLVWSRQRMSYLPFYRVGFFPFPRPMNLQVGYLNQEISLEGALGVFDQII